MSIDMRAYFRIALDEITVARLLEVADGCQTDPCTVIAAIVKDVLEDDAKAHDGELVPLTVQ